MSDILGRVMLAFEGDVLPSRVRERLAAAPVTGMTVFRHHNVRTPGQLRDLTDAFQHAGAARLLGSSPPPVTPPAVPLLVAADQEGGQLQALGDGATQFAGNMALGAVGDVALTAAVGRAIGTEARAMGVNVVYAPCLDIASNPANPAAGIRSFGDDPAAVAAHGAAMVNGLQSAGVAAGIKHAPGMGHAATDTHHGLASVDAPREVLDAREFAPFRACVAAGARMIMSGHVALPGVTGSADLPSTLSRAVMTDLLRGDFGFDGVTITDALDMRALAQGEAQVLDVVAAVRAGVDLLLAAADPVALARIEATLVHADARRLFDVGEVGASLRRIDAVRAWLRSAGAPPDIDVVGCAEHQALANDLAARSITLVRDPAGRLPVVAGSTGRVVAIMPRPADLTPADTSSTVAPGLAGAMRDAGFVDVDEIVVEQDPGDAEISAVTASAREGAVVVVGTIDGHRQPSQIRLVEALAATDVPTIAVAMRGPWDVVVYPAGVTALATYSILPGSLRALAEVLVGRASAHGTLPVQVPTAVAS